MPKKVKQSSNKSISNKISPSQFNQTILNKLCSSPYRIEQKKTSQGIRCQNISPEKNNIKYLIILLGACRTIQDQFRVIYDHAIRTDGRGTDLHIIPSKRGLVMIHKFVFNTGTGSVVRCNRGNLKINNYLHARSVS